MTAIIAPTPDAVQAKEDRSRAHSIAPAAGGVRAKMMTTHLIIAPAAEAVQAKRSRDCNYRRAGSLGPDGFISLRSKSLGDASGNCLQKLGFLASPTGFQRDLSQRRITLAFNNNSFEFRLLS